MVLVVVKLVVSRDECFFLFLFFFSHGRIIISFILLSVKHSNGDECIITAQKQSSWGWRGQVHHIHHGIGHIVGYPLTPPPRTSDLGTYPLPLLLTSGGHHTRHVHTCFLADLPLPWYLHLVAATTRRVGKRTVHILMSCWQRSR